MDAYETGNAGAMSNIKRQGEDARPPSYSLPAFRRLMNRDDRKGQAGGVHRIEARQL